MRELGELGLIRRIRDGGRGAPAAGVPVGIGDDAAVLAVTPGAALLATTDLVIEDVHFRRAWAAPADVGWKAMAVNLSDIAAMGGVPRWALVAFAVPRRHPRRRRGRLLRAACGRRRRPTGWPSWAATRASRPRGWLINVTLLGEHAGRPRLRSAARAGDAIAVTGTLGRSAAGLAVLEMGAGRGAAPRGARDGDRRGDAGAPPAAGPGGGGPVARRRARRARHARLLGRTRHRPRAHLPRVGGGGARGAGPGSHRLRRRGGGAGAGPRAGALGHRRRRGLRAPAHL